MNKARRLILSGAAANLSKAALLIERATDEERDAFDNLPESIQDGERGQKMEDAIDLLEDISDMLEEILDKLDEAAG